MKKLTGSKKSPRIITYCKVCNKEIISTLYRYNLGFSKYCCKRHEYIGRRHNLILKCKICKKEFRPRTIVYYKKGWNKYCSKECQFKSKEWRNKISETSKGRISWSKGLTKETNLSLRKSSEKRIGCVTWNKGKKLPQFSGENHWRWKGEKPKCLDCNKELFRENKSGRCKICFHKYYSGEKHWGYVKESKRNGYPIIFNDVLKEEIRKRDNYQCQNKECNIIEEEHIIVYGKRLNIHHIDYNKENCSETNLITLCFQCNIRANYNRNY